MGPSVFYPPGGGGALAMTRCWSGLYLNTDYLSNTVWLMGDMERSEPETEPMKSNLGSSSRALVACMWTHCLNSSRLRLVPSRTTSWALDPLYWTTLNPDSLPANWKEKHCMVTVCYGLCVLCLRACVFLWQHFCVPPILTNYIHTGRGESLERHKSKIQTPRQYFSFTLSILRSVFRAEFLNVHKNSFRNIFWYKFE